MPFSTNTKNNDFGHAQVLRDIEYLYLYLKGDTPGYVNQSIQDDGITGESLDNRIINLGGGGGGETATTQNLRVFTVKTTSNNKSLGYGTPTLRGAVWNATPLSAGTPLSSAYDPNSETAITDDGICYASDNATGESVLLVQRAVDGQGGGILTFDLPQACLFLAYRQIQVPVSGGTSVLAWEAYWA